MSRLSKVSSKQGPPMRIGSMFLFPFLTMLCFATNLRAQEQANEIVCTSATACKGGSLPVFITSGGSAHGWGAGPGIGRPASGGGGHGPACSGLVFSAAAAGAFVVRSGLVWADGPPSGGGMFGSLARSAGASMVPLIDGGSHPQYLIHEQDLFELLRRFCDGELQNPGKPVVAAAAWAWPMRDLLVELARRQGRQPRFMPVPWQPVWAGLRLAEMAHLPVPYRSDSVVSLVYQDPKPDFESLKALGITARNFS